MIQKKIFKVLISVLCIITLIMPHMSIVLARTLENNTSNANTTRETAYFSAKEAHENGYAYKAYQSGNENGTKILKIVEGSSNPIDYSNELYCVDVTKSFPEGTPMQYEKVIKDLFEQRPSDDKFKITQDNYNSLCWLLKNMYLRHQMEDTQKEAQLANMVSQFKSKINVYGSEDLPNEQSVIDLITEDDIEIVQQWAIWYFTNNGGKTIQNVDIVQRNNGTPVLPILDMSLIPAAYNNMPNNKKEILNAFYQYLIETAEANKNIAPNTSSHPSLEQTNPTAVKEGSNYKIGPFRLSGIASGDYTMRLMEDSKKLNGSLVDTNGNTLTGNIESIVNQDYYINVPETEITSIDKVVLKLTYYETKASIWKKVDVNNNMKYDETYQPVVLITRQSKEEKVSLKSTDLALRKFITKVNDTEITNRVPNVDRSKLDNGQSTTAEYKHRKDPVDVKTGDLVTYKIAVFNEGEVDAKAKEIVDYLPEGLEFVKDNQTNSIWNISEDGRVATTKAMENEKITADGQAVEIVCRVTSTTTGAVLTNFAEIKEDDIEDRDSTPGSFGSVSSDYTGRQHITDLTNPNYYYKGMEDDDDFEKVKVAGKPFDLSLQKFITKLNSKEVANREPVVDTTPLKNKATDADYKQVKTPILVQKGDIVTYKIRVYNEGEVDGYAESIADYLPDGLGYLINYNGNINNYWAIPENAGAQTIKLSEIPDGTKNLKVEDFNGITDLSNVDVVKGAVKLTSTALSSSSPNNLIKAFDNSDKLNYKDIEVTCIVLENANLKNIAEITKDLDGDKKEVTDRDSTPDTVDPNNYPGNDKDQDDNDYEKLTMRKFDLALQKFITGLNDKEIKDRVPVVNYKNGNITYKHPDTPLEVNNGDNVIYTIRVYNEGDVDGYASEISDDIPDGLLFDTENEINKKYGWKMIDSSGQETTDASKAVEIRTDYLSKEKSEARNENALLSAFNLNQTQISYLDVGVAFKVNAKKANDVIINTAEITNDTDSDGNEIDDIDSVPDNKKEKEDDIDREKIHVGYFDLALQKDLTKAIIIEGKSTKEISAIDGQLKKVEINRKKINSTIVKFVYNVTITNEGTISGYAKEIKDYIPEGLEFAEADNEDWKASSDGTITTEALADKLLEPGESASVPVVLRWVNGENNLGLKTNVAEISKDYNDANDTDDIDSTPDNKKDGEDDIDDAPVILAIATGSRPVYVILLTGILAIISTGIVMIKKYIL